MVSESKAVREILFRAKTIASESMWVEGFYNHIPCGRFLCDEHCIQTINADGRIGQLFVVCETTLGQFTGLTDKNGKKIFEGDIVQGKDRLEKHLEVFGYIDHKNGSFVITGDFMTHYRWLDYEVEVIGNIYDNPELLEGHDG